MNRNLSFGWTFDKDSNTYFINRNNNPTIPPYKIHNVPTKIIDCGVHKIEIVDTGGIYHLNQRKLPPFFKRLRNRIKYHFRKIRTIPYRILANIKQHIHVFIGKFIIDWKYR